MAPLQKAARRKSRSASEDNTAEQAGRTSASIAAQAAAAAYEEAQRNAFRQPRPSSVPVAEDATAALAEGPLMMKKSPSAPNVRMMQSVKRLSSGQTPLRNQAYTPIVSSPLNPNSPPDSLTSRNSNGDSISESAETSAPAATDVTIPPIPTNRSSSSLAPKKRPLSANMLKVPSSTQILTREVSSSGLATPMSTRGLGSDYTRYFNPWTDSRRSSYQEVPTGVQTPGRHPNTSRLSMFETLSEHSAISSIDSNDPNKEKYALLQQSFLDDRLGSSPYLLSKGQPNAFPMFLDEKEDDDDMHMPMADDNVRFRTTLRSRFNRENACTTFGLIFMFIGIAFLFIAMPILFYTGTWEFKYAYDTPKDQLNSDNSGPGGIYGPPESWATVNDRKYPFLKNIRTGLIDRHTPESAYSRKSYDGSTLKLVFSDEFNDNNRTFYNGDDPFWEAQDIWYGATQDLEWYDPDAVTTWDGVMEIRMDEFNNHNLKLRSGMVNSWNKMCFKGGIFEVSVSLPGPGGAMGLWPGVWTMGNLGRPGYLSTTDGLWPYTYNECDAGITPNQSDPSGISRLPGQRLPSCACSGEDHPTPGTGRGAPEIDILEASASYSVKNLGVATQSFQVAPFDPWYMPDYDYVAFPDPSLSYTNSWTGGPYQQAISGVTVLNDDWYDGKQYQKYAFDYRPGTGEDGWITWFTGEDPLITLDGRAIRRNGNVGDRAISQEPMSMVMNLGISNSWVAIDWESLKFPTVMRIDYVRIYQPEDNQLVTCDPPGYETTQYIADHMLAYTNPNLTKWAQTKYGWPKHKLNTPGCKVGSK